MSLKFSVLHKYGGQKGYRKRQLAMARHARSALVRKETLIHTIGIAEANKACEGQTTLFL